MSTTSTGAGGRRAQVAHRAVEGERRLLVPGDHLGLDAEPLAHPGDEDVGVRGVPGRRGGAEPDPRRRHVVRARSARRTRRSRRTPAPAPRRRAGRCGRRPGRAAPSASRGRRRRAASPISSLIVLVPQSIAATGPSRAVGSASGVTQGPAAHQSPSRSSTSSPSGFTPRPWASDWPASTCRHLTRSGMPPAEMPSISGTSGRGCGRARRAPRGSARAPRGRPRASSGSSPSRSCISFIRPEPSRVPIREAARGQVR